LSFTIGGETEAGEDILVRQLRKIGKDLRGSMVMISW